jgi:predicted YcjX-like family ATPase
MSDIVPRGMTTASGLAGWVGDWATPTVRLGVTGLSRAGKTVFITALVANLIGKRRLPFFAAHASGRLKDAYLQPQPDDAVPRFAYQRHVADLTASPPSWPSSTRQISQLRVTLDVDPQHTIASLIGARQLHVDIVDYPGEWLLDLGLMELDYDTWSDQVLDRVMRPDHDEIAAPFKAKLAALDPDAAFTDAAAEALADAFRAYLIAARKRPPGLATLGPGRFLMPGEYEGSPMLTFAPLPRDMRTGDGAAKRAFAAELERRFEVYKAKIVRPFFRNHFAKLDRQIVLVDALAALNGGQRSLDDLRSALTASLAAFRPGQSGWLSRLIGDRRIDKVLFAATKADQIPQASHPRLEAILKHLTDEANGRATGEGANIGVLALAAIRATKETVATVKGEDLACIKGVPLAGEEIDGTVFDGTETAAVFPGDLPDDPVKAITAAEQGAFADVRFLRFSPPRLAADAKDAPSEPWPHVRLDRALEFLLADRLP